ncbi:hypothetical protein KCP70_03785 [Salmonella enterica subsp. enterica]|nr:hypothetical protein KCP70_03785 [Salmonella enterica subsp. enterica]
MNTVVGFIGRVSLQRQANYPRRSRKITLWASERHLDGLRDCCYTNHADADGTLTKT